MQAAEWGLRRAERRVSFAFETTLSGRSHLALLRKLKAEGYDIHFFFLWLKSVELALSRVKERVSRGGHDVPEPVVRRRFDRSMQNFLLYYRPLAKVWTRFDNSGEVPKGIALERDEMVRIIDRSAYTALVKRYGRQQRFRARQFSTGSFACRLISSLARHCTVG
jgi:predicted ABC-type ATPase